MRRIALVVLSAFIIMAFCYQLFLINFHQPAAFETKMISLAFTSECILLVVAILLFKELLSQRKKLHHVHLEMANAVAKSDEQKEYLDVLFEHSGLSIAIIQLDGRVTKVNRAFSHVLGYSESDKSINYFTMVHTEDLGKLQEHIQTLLDKKEQIYQCEQQCSKKNGEIVWMASTLSLIRDHQGKPAYFVLQMQDISWQKRAEERLQHMAYHDALTGLANRNKLEQFVNHTLAIARRQHTSFAILFMDLDRFKHVNDSIGHEAGDVLLQIIAERLRNAVRSTDMVARLGGDEFILLISDVKKSESVALIAQKILSSVLEAITIHGQEIYITTSIGISIYPGDGQNMQSLLKHADLALYRAKEYGRNNYQFYTTEMTARAQDKLSLQNALGHALAKNEFLLHYQPKMELATRRINGVEALLRWRNKEYSAVTPNEIVALAEETGLIVPVSDWVLRTACKQLKRWHEMGMKSLTMAVNCSKRQFKHATFVDEVLSAITQSGVPASAIEIEITESVVMEDPENTLRVLYALKDLGVQIVVDDFGTGYWSLNNLRRLSIDKIKIDKTFIRQMLVDDTSALITCAILAMANKLNIRSVAEGVETREQYEFLAREGCSEIQGYYLTQPMAEELMTRFLKHPVPDAEVISKTELT